MEIKQKTKLTLSKKDKIVFLALILIIIGCIIGIQLASDERPEIIRIALERHGLCADGVDFEFVMNSGFRARIYQSSSPICYEGTYASLWRIRRYGLGLGFTFSYRVAPYLPDE